MRTLPYPIAQNGLTPKHVRDAFKMFAWPNARTLRHAVAFGRVEQASVDAYAKAKTYLRERTIADVAAPKTWWLVCALWNSRRMASVRAQFAPTSEHLADETELTPASQDALDAFVTVLVIHLLSEGSPLQRLRALGARIAVEETPEQVAARERAEARETAARTGVRAVIESARRDGRRVQLDARALLGDTLVQKNEFLRIRCGELVATIKRAVLDEAALVLLGKPVLYAYIEPHPHELPGHGQLCLRWSSGNGRNGGLALHHTEVERDRRGTVKRTSPATIDDSWCTVIDIPHDVPRVDEPSAETTMRVCMWQRRLHEAKEEL